MKIITNGIEHEHDDHGAAEAAQHGFARSEHWPIVEKEFRAKNPCCVISGSINVQIHHTKVEFHWARILGRWELEFSERNLTTLAQEPGNEKHRIVGHLLFFQSWNKDKFDYFVRKYRALESPSNGNGFCCAPDEHILADPEFIAAVNARPVPFAKFTAPMIQGLRKWIDEALPILPDELERFAKWKPPLNQFGAVQSAPA